ncbi:N-glycosyltransferase [archaeon]|nr:N-glycosyltransferase [archaeon]
MIKQKIWKKSLLVSIIITTKNEEKNIANCLESIRTQSYPSEKIEIIVVDNNSTDRTNDKYIQKSGKDDPIIKKQLGLWYRFFKVFIENGKWKRLKRNPALTVAMYVLGIIRRMYVMNKGRR